MPAFGVGDWQILLVDFGEEFVLADSAGTLVVVPDFPTAETGLGTSHLTGLLDAPQALASDADIAEIGVAEGSVGTLRGKTWRVDKIEPTGDGASRIALAEKQEAEDEGDERTWR